MTSYISDCMIETEFSSVKLSNIHYRYCLLNAGENNDAEIMSTGKFEVQANNQVSLSLSQTHTQKHVY